MPSSALLRGRRRRRRPRAPSALIRSHWRLTSDAVSRLGVAEHVRVAADDLRGERGLDVGQVEDAFLGGELGVQDDLQQQVAELAGQLGGRAALERVVDLVRLLEQVVAQRGVGLLAVPRTAVRLAQPVADPGHRPRSRRRPPRARAGRGSRARRGSAASRAPMVVASAAPEPPDRVVRRVEAAEDRQRVVAAGSVAAGQRRHRLAAPVAPEQRGRHDQHGPRRLDGRADEPLGGDQLDARARIQSPAQPRLGQEGVQHARSASPRWIP